MFSFIFERSFKSTLNFGVRGNCGDFPLPTDDEAKQELRNLDLGGN